MESTVKVLVASSRELIGQYPISKIHLAYEFAADMENMGVEVIVEAPTVCQTLSESLGHDETQLEQLNDELNNEIDQHND